MFSRIRDIFVANSQKSDDMMRVLRSYDKLIREMDGVTHMKLCIAVKNLVSIFHATWGGTQQFLDQSEKDKLGWVAKIEAAIPKIMDAERKDPSVYPSSIAQMLMAIYWRALATSHAKLANAVVDVIEPLNRRANGLG